MNSKTSSPPQDSYILARDFRSASRLNYEHYLWKETLGYNLHPLILNSLTPTANANGTTAATTPPQPLIADIACGTAIWLRQVAQSLPHTQLHGFDISLAQCPPTQWLPSQITLREWDLFSEPPEDLLGHYDVIHVRLLLVVVRNEDSDPVLRQLLRLLKPGGYLQWDELDVSGSFILRAEEGVEAPVMEGMLGALRQKAKWVDRLAERAEECGFVEGKMWRIVEKEELARAFFDNHLVKDEEMAGSMLNGKMEGERLLGAVERMFEESKKGVVLCTPKVVCTARKRVEADDRRDMAESV
ncbi:MAG: hypothetical protein Q9164_005948 [Protoblastenia rupestris]